jgi:hypothetical protein
MRSTTIVFRGVEQVVDAYEANDIGPWAIVNGNDILCADSPDTVAHGTGMLREALDRLRAGNCRAAFDLRVYKVPAGTDIEPNMKPYRAFRFSLYEDAELTPYEAGRKRALSEGEGRYTLLQQEINELKAKVAEYESEELEPTKPDTIGAMIGGFLEDPMIKQALKVRMIGLIDKIVPLNPQNRPAAIAGINGPAMTTTDQAQPKASILMPDQQQKAQAALNTLCGIDPKLGDHLAAIAKIAVEDPKQYSFIVGMLK